MAIQRGYVGARSCTDGPQPGARGLMAWFLAKYTFDGGVNSGIYNCRPIRGTTLTTSLHGEGRAVDLGIRPYGAGYGTELAELLRLNSKELGIQCIIWNRKIFSGGYTSTNWVHYGGVNPHVDHLHVELTWEAARRSADDMIALCEKHLTVELLPAGAIATEPVVDKKPVTVEENSGNSKADNIAIAKLLNALGYAAGVPDGVPGPYLKAGVLAYQRNQQYYPNMLRDGEWGPMTQAHFDWVRGELQPQLNRWAASLRVSRLVHDGDYGPLVKRCVKATQTDNYGLYRKAGGYYKDGLAGPITCKFLKCDPHPAEGAD